jgi:hypothetical protein
VPVGLTVDLKPQQATSAVSPRGGYPKKRPAQESLGGNTLEYNWPLILLPFWFLHYLYSSLVHSGGERGREKEKRTEEKRAEGEKGRREVKERREGGEKGRRRTGEEGFI